MNGYKSGEMVVVFPEGGERENPQSVQNARASEWSEVEEHALPDFSVCRRGDRTVE